MDNKCSECGYEFNKDYEVKCPLCKTKKSVVKEIMKMREFRFRGWDKVHHQMYYDLCSSEQKHTLIWTLMQYTGLKDKHGKVIYEGDVLKDEFGLGEVKWVQEHCSFVVYAPEKGYYFLESGDGELLISTEVIGNIYENPEWEF